MSLLLDALKKAADDKKKNLVNDKAENSPNDNHESLELDLNFDSDIANKTSVADDFPQVDETSIQKPTTEIASTEHKDKTDNINNNTLSEETDLTDTTDLVEKDLETDAVGTNDSNALNEPETSVEAITAVKSMPPELKSAADENSAETNNSAITNNSGFSKNIENEKALLALINKSNQHSKKVQLKQTITIAILVTLLLIGSALFFYIKMDTASQEIFIANNNQAPVNRAVEIKPKANPPVAVKTITAIKNTAPPKQTIVRKVTKKTKPIHVVHTQKEDPVNTLILEAYNQFHLKNYKQANKLYNQVLSREPKNRDALLGLSAIAVKQQRYEFARQKYQYLLRLNPKDSIAIAGINSIKNDTDPQLNESQLKFMLKEKPDSAHLHFALGTLYSSHKKWPEAQSAYFSAWSADNKNSDYAYNLAVSLDHLDKRDQALSFYELSIKLKQASSGNFSTENVLQRTRTLKENNE